MEGLGIGSRPLHAKRPEASADMCFSSQLISLSDSRRGHSVHGTLEAILTIDLRSNFGRNGEQIWPESETCTQKTLDGDFDAYVCGLGGAE